MTIGTTTRVVPLGTIVNVFSGLTPYGRAPVGSGTTFERLIGTRDLQDGSIVADSVETIQVDDARKVTDYRVLEGDVLLTIRGTAPRAAVCDPEIAGCLAGANLVIIRLRPDAPIGPNLLLSFLESPAGQMALKSMSQGTSTLGIRPKTLVGLPISVPSAETAAKLEQLCLLLRETRRKTKEALLQRERLVFALAGKYLTTSGAQA
jgi:restriction endonuclease S subunit